MLPYPVRPPLSCLTTGLPGPGQLQGVQLAWQGKLEWKGAADHATLG